MDGACIDWQGYHDRDGYARLGYVSPHGRRAARVFYIEAHGPVPEGFVIDHLCRNRGCVNVDHLEAVSNRTNLLRGDTFQAANAAKTHCKRGHPFTPANTYRMPQGGRSCRTCGRAAQARYHRNKKARTA